MIKFFLLTILFSFSAFGQVQLVHPKVTELQEKIRYDIRDYLGSVLPNGSFIISVKLDPLRRGVPAQFDNKEAEALPYMQIGGGSKVQDEWDDPEIPMYNLYKRIRSVKIQIDLSQEVDIKNIDQFKRELIKEIGLVSGRDYIEIKRGLNFSLQKSWTEQIFSIETILMFSFCMVIAAGFYIQSRALKNVGKSFSQNNAGASGQSAAPVVASAPRSNYGSDAKKRSKELSVSNPILLRDVVRAKLDELEKCELFPLLTDMITLEELAKEDQEAFSFLVYEFQMKHQTEILKRGRTRNWLEAFSSASNASNSAVRSLDMMIRSRQLSEDKIFEELIIQMWRLGDKLEEFISSMDRQFAISALSRLPKRLALPIARTLFPGDWGKVLDTKKILFDSAQVERELNRALDIMPYYDFNSLGELRSQKDLLSYIQTCGIQEEKDIYVMRGSGDILERIRPPFYLFFELEKEQMVDIFFKFTLEDWALAVFNSSRKYVETFESFLTEKQRFLLSDNLKSLNQNRPHKLEIARMREKIALVVDDAQKNSKIKRQHQSNHEDLDAPKAA
ncbi:MAG: hypothetical protein KC493_12210 [Bacteriovoracaceae bacterium]|nr:hypothetical protein [Bacteriovoracaceae bacterium]